MTTLSTRVCAHTDTARVEPGESATSQSLRRAEQEQRQHLPEQEKSTLSAELEISHFADLVLAYLKAPASTKHSLRRYVVEELRICRHLSERISTLLCAAVDSNRPERLDDAIDVLGNKQVDLATYLLTKTHQDLKKLDDDTQYILIRAAGKRLDGCIGHVACWALESKRASLQEAAVEALVEFDTAESLAIVREIADGDADEAVKQVAAEYLSELEEG